MPVRNSYISLFIIITLSFSPLMAQKEKKIKSLLPIDSITKLQEVVVSQQSKKRIRVSPVPAIVIDKEYLHRHLAGVWVNTLSAIPGVRAMSVGGGFGKPMIRGLGFSRVAYVEGDIKQEGQQWGADHGLEVDAFENNQVTVIKGPRSLLYGSEALGGVIISALPVIPLEKGLYGEFSGITSSANGLLGASLLAGYSSGKQHFRLRYSEQHYGDLRVNTDSITYLTINIPIYQRRMKNTAGYNRSIKASYSNRIGDYTGFLQVSNVFEKVGFFPGAHGIPDLSRLNDDGQKYNIELPFSKVNHLKVYSKHAYLFQNNWLSSLSFAYQNNHRTEWSLFHTHYRGQKAPNIDPDKELELDLKTLSLRGEVSYYGIEGLKVSAVADYLFRHQDIAGYGFLIPSYLAHSAGWGAVAEYQADKHWKIEGGIRYDIGNIKAKERRDPYLAKYLTENHFSENLIQENILRSNEIDRTFGSFSGSLGGAFHQGETHFLNFGVGLGFRFPGIHELASNGVHHGSFRHDRGDINLSPERALQGNVTYRYIIPQLELSLDGFYNYFFNYIYGTPTGRWSVLPHAGQIYQYKQNKALLFGGELSLKWHLFSKIHYETALEYVYTYNVDLDTPLPFSPPLRWRESICYRPQSWEVALTHTYIGEANRIVPGEDITPSSHLLDLYASYEIPFSKKQTLILSLSANNLFNTKYFDHLSFYRKIGLPEEGRNFKITFKITF